MKFQEYLTAAKILENGENDTDYVAQLLDPLLLGGMILLKRLSPTRSLDEFVVSLRRDLGYPLSQAEEIIHAGRKYWMAPRKLCVVCLRGLGRSRLVHNTFPVCNHHFGGNKDKGRAAEVVQKMIIPEYLFNEWRKYPNAERLALVVHSVITRQKRFVYKASRAKNNISGEMLDLARNYDLLAFSIYRDSSSTVISAEKHDSLKASLAEDLMSLNLGSNWAYLGGTFGANCATGSAENSSSGKWSLKQVYFNCQYLAVI
jgi:hypothetical protein